MRRDRPHIDDKLSIKSKRSRANVYVSATVLVYVYKISKRIGISGLLGVQGIS